MDKTWADLLESEDLDLLRQARVGRLATVGAGGFPSVVPICFALLDDPEATVVSVLDEKAKNVPDAELGRVRNILRHSKVMLTIDHYEEDWSKLFHIQVRGVARLVSPSDSINAVSIGVLRRKYEQYVAMELEARAVIAISELRVRVWHASDSGRTRSSGR